MWDTFILNPMINALLFLYRLLGGSFGLAIIVFTILIRLATYPLMASSQKSMKKMQDLQGSKEWKDLAKKYAKDKEKMQAEQMKLLQSSGANPLGGCLPMILQFPIMIGLYQAIGNVVPSTPLQLFSFSQRIYAFFPSALIPLTKTFLWMNLGTPEHLSIPGLPFAIPVLAILVLITSLVSQRIIPMMTTDAQSAQTNLIMNVFMVLLFTNISLSLASGLSVYFVTTNLLTIVQYMLMGRVNWRQIWTISANPGSTK
jgi:YidC/Oxa1 family membrane protein insertase